jgi:hypothetical protein
MAANEQIQIENLSPTPIEEEEEQQPVAQPQETPVAQQQPQQPTDDSLTIYIGGKKVEDAEQGFMDVPGEETGVQEAAPAEEPRVLQPVEREAAAEQTPAPQFATIPRKADPQEVQKSITDKSFVPAAAPPPAVTPEERPEPTMTYGKPVIPEVSYINQPIPSTVEEAQQQIRMMGNFYTQEALTKNLPEGSSVEKRLGHVNKAYYFRIPRLDENGDVSMLRQLDPNTGKYTVTPEYETDLIEFEVGNIESGEFQTPMKLIEMFEYQGGPNNGAYYLFDKDQNFVGGFDIGLGKLQREAQNPMEWVFRNQTEEGGTGMLIDVMKNNGVTNPARLRYYADQDIKSGTFGGIELHRTKWDTGDILTWMGKFGFGEGLEVPGTDMKVGFGEPLIDGTSMLNAYMANLTVDGWLQDWNPAAPDRTPEEMYNFKYLTDNMKEKLVKNYTDTAKGKVSSSTLLYAHEELKKQFPYATDLEIQAYRDFSKDLTTRAKRYIAESMVTAPTYMFGLFRMGASEMKALTKFAQTKMKRDTPFKDEADMFASLEKEGLNFGDLLKEYYSENGMKGLSGQLVARGLDARLQSYSRKSPFYDYVVAKRFEEVEDEISRIATKIKTAKTEKRSAKYINTLEAQLKAAQRNYRDMQKRVFIPPVIKQAIKEDAIASVAAAAAYQYLFEATDYNEFTGNIGALSAALLSTSQFVRNVPGDALSIAKETGVSLFSRDRADALRVSRKFRREMENTVPELRNRALQALEFAAESQENLRKFKYPAGHSKEGQQVFRDDLVEQSIAQMIGFHSMRKIADTLMERDIHVAKDVGKLSKRLADYEKLLEQQSELIDTFGGLVESFKVYRYSSKFDGASPEGILAKTMIDFHRNEVNRLKAERQFVEDAMKGVKRDIQSFMNADIEPKTLAEYLDGRRQLSDLLAVDFERTIGRDLPPNAGLAERIDAVQTYFGDVQARLTESLEKGSKFSLDPDANGRVANNMLQDVLSVQEQKMYALAGARYDAIRANPLYADSRMDLTSFFDNYVNVKDGDIAFDDMTLAKNAGLEGTPESLRLRGLGMKPGLKRGVEMVFEGSAREYMNDIRKKMGSDRVQTIMEKARGEDFNPQSAMDEWLVMREFFEDQLSKPQAERIGQMSDARITDLKPRLGVDASSYMNIISGLGKRGADSDAVTVRRLRSDLIANSVSSDPTKGFVDNFYGPKSKYEVTEGIGEEMAQAREYWRNYYWQPFKGERSKVIGSILKAPDDQSQLNALDRFISEMLINKKGVSAGELNQPGGFFDVLRGINGGEPLDVTKGLGAQISKVLTAKAYEEIARTRGALALRRDLLVDYNSAEFAGTPGMSFDVKSVLLAPKKAAEIDAQIKYAPTDTPLVNNLLSGKFVDDNGVSFINPRIKETINFEAGIAAGNPKFEQAAKQVDDTVQDATEDYLRRLDDVQSPERQELVVRQKLMENIQGSLGGHFIQVADSPTGIATIKAMENDFVEAAVSGNLKDVDGKPFSVQLSEEKARELFNSVVKNATIDELLKRVQRPGDQVAGKTVSQGDTVSVKYRERNIDGNKLADELGQYGTTSDIVHVREKGLRYLLGDDTYDHMTFVYDQLYREPSRGDINLTGVSIPLSAESMLSRGTSFFRGVISARWLISEAAIRRARHSNYELTKLLLTDPKYGAQILRDLTERNFDLGKREPDYIAVLLDTIAKADAIQAYASDQYVNTKDFVPQMPSFNASGVESQMDQLNLQP